MCQKWRSYGLSDSRSHERLRVGLHAKGQVLGIPHTEFHVIWIEQKSFLKERGTLSVMIFIAVQVIKQEKRTSRTIRQYTSLLQQV
jgi:hypothetical protein